MFSRRFFLQMLALVALIQSYAFEVTGRSALRQDISTRAWTLPTDTTFVFKSTWYNEYNPTARTTIYKDSYSSLDNFGFVTPGDDWPSISTTTTVTDVNPRKRSNFFKRALRRRALLKSFRQGSFH